jgi:hypothetical protein
MRSYLVLLCSPLVVAVAAWIALAACIDAPPEPRMSPGRLVVGWDPLACGDPHRLVVELRDEAGAVLSASTPCSLGTLAIDVAHFGSYRARIYAWVLDPTARPTAPGERIVDLTIDQPIAHWDVTVPP